MKSTTSKIVAGVVAAGLAYGAGALGNLAMRGKGRPTGRWFRNLNKSRLEPPRTVFAPVWGVLYGSIAFAGWRIWRSKKSAARTRALRLWGTQLALNAAWTPLFFGARKPALALADMAALDAATAACIHEARKVDGAAAAAMVPYLGWLGFATMLNGAIVAKNR
jgi:tryptophan-rich sensory protein